MRTILLILLALSVAARAEEPDWKALFEQADKVSKQWRERALALEAENAALRARLSGNGGAAVPERVSHYQEPPETIRSATTYFPPVTTTPTPSGPVQVRGYTKKDGTYVAPHTRKR